MNLRLLTLFCSVALCTGALAMPTVEAEAAFEHALLIADSIEERFDQATAQEHEGKVDRGVLAQLFENIDKDSQIYEEELQKASGAGHGAATFLLGGLYEGRRAIYGYDHAAMHTKACELYQKATDQGLSAAAVMLFRECNEAFIRSMFGGPELLRQRNQLLKALEQPDPYSDHYPLPALYSYCFKDSQLPKPNTQQPLTTLKELYRPILLSQAQFHADGYYLLAFKGNAKDLKVQAYLKQAQLLAADCLDPFNLQTLFKSMETKNH